MIRIDEIYQNVFLPRALKSPGVGLHWFDPFGSTDIKDMVNLPAIPWGVAKKRLIFWDQEPVYQHEIEKFLEYFKSVYDGQIILITSEKDSNLIENLHNRYGIESRYYFFHAWAALDWYRGYDRTLLYRPFADRSILYTFLCPNNVIGGKRLHRIELLKELVQRNLIRKNLVSFPKICPYENVSVMDLCKKYQIEFDWSKIKLPLIIDNNDDHHRNSHKINFWEAADKTLLQVVTETVFRGQRQHLTEKTFKPIVMQQPFILVSCRGSLEYLRSYGFQTFRDFWDESYDQEDDDHRIEKIGKLCEDLSNLSGREVRQLQKHLYPVVKHNFDWFYSKEYENILWNELKQIL